MYVDDNSISAGRKRAQLNICCASFRGHDRINIGVKEGALLREQVDITSIKGLRLDLLLYSEFIFKRLIWRGFLVFVYSCLLILRVRKSHSFVCLFVCLLFVHLLRYQYNPFYCPRAVRFSARYFNKNPYKPYIF